MTTEPLELQELATLARPRVGENKVSRVKKILGILINKNNFSQLSSEEQQEALELKDDIWTYCYDFITNPTGTYSLLQQANYFNDLINERAGALSGCFHQPRNTFGNMITTLWDILAGDDISTAGETTSIKGFRDIAADLNAKIEERRWTALPSEKLDLSKKLVDEPKHDIRSELTAKLNDKLEKPSNPKLQSKSIT